MFHSPILGTFRAAALAGLLVMPAGVAFAAASAMPQSDATAQQAATRGTPAPADQSMSRGLQATNASDVYGRPTLGEEAKQHPATGFSNEPDWRGTEYTGQ